MNEFPKTAGQLESDDHSKNVATIQVWPLLLFLSKLLLVKNFSAVM
jgi:hypothetical protein